MLRQYFMAICVALLAAAAASSQSLAQAQPQAQPQAQEQVVRIAFIDPLSGPAAAVTQNGLNHFRFMAERLSTPTRRYEIVAYDNKLSPQESVVAAQKAIDAGIRFIAQGNSSAVAAALSEFISRHNERAPDRAALLLNYAAIDPVLTNEKCSPWHFRFDAHADMKMLALADFIARRQSVRRVYLINQDYSFGQAVRASAQEMLRARRPDLEIVGDELHPLAKITDFSPYVAKIRASGADAVVTGNWGSDLALLLKAAAETGLKAEWYTFYASGIGSPTAIRQSGLAHQVFGIVEAHANQPEADVGGIETAFRARFGGSFNVPRIALALRMLDQALGAPQSGGDPQPRDVAARLARAQVADFYGATAMMRAQDQQVLQDLHIVSFGPLQGSARFDEEKTGWGWQTQGRLAAAATALPSSCRMPPR